jgi:hypothetical protein
MPSSDLQVLSVRSADDARIDADDRVLVEAMLAQDRLLPTPTDDPAADEAARLADGDPERMLTVRARSLVNAGDLIDAIRHVRQTMSLLVSVSVVLALLGGAGAARVALGSPRAEPVNFFLVLGALLGLQTILLLIWLYVMIFARRNAAVAMAAASLGGLIMALARRLVRWTHRGDRGGRGREHMAAVAATGTVLMRGSLGKWTFSAVSHGLWLAFNVGCLAMIITLLSARQYTFAWETTILSPDFYVPMTKSIAVLPRMAGFGAPDDDQIKASQWISNGSTFGQTPQNSQAWSALLVGSMVVYGFGPRLLLLALSLGQRRAARARYRIDVGQPVAARMLERVAPASRHLGVIDPADDSRLDRDTARHGQPRPNRPPGGPAILGLEIERPRTGWPPHVANLKWQDLGFVEDRNDRQRVVSQLREAATEPRTVIVACGLANTPDRGVASFLRDAAESVSTPIVVLLTGGHHLRQRGDSTQLQQRIADWREIMAGAGVSEDRVIELDLDHLTNETAARLGMIAQTDASGVPAHARRLEHAFTLIGDYFRRLGHANAAPDQELAALHSRIAALYRDTGSAPWQALLTTPAGAIEQLGKTMSEQDPRELVINIKASAQKFAQLLPERLRRSPNWMAAGAAAGALGCVAAATLVSPVAIGGLPIWSAVGAAIAAVVQPASKSNAPTDETAASERGDAVRSAALLAMVLELQGRGEAVITRVLDQAIPDDAAEKELMDEAAVKRWLDDVRHRFDLAMTREAGR